MLDDTKMIASTLLEAYRRADSCLPALVPSLLRPQEEVDSPEEGKEDDAQLMLLRHP
jgi:hypothetical protein